MEIYLAFGFIFLVGFVYFLAKKVGSYQQENKNIREHMKQSKRVRNEASKDEKDYINMSDDDIDKFLRQ